MRYLARVISFATLLWALIALVLGIALKVEALVHASAVIAIFTIVVIVLEAL
jgi:hypothetical protein